MKVDGPNKTGATGKAGKKSGSGKADGSFSDFITSGPSKSVSSGTTQSIVQVDALLALQGAEDPTERASRGRMRQRADDILDELDKVRMAMLKGDLTVGHMVNIADVVASHREKISDPHLTALMDEVDLRAQVELAKLRVSLERKTH